MTFKAGIKAAHDYLISTAEDYKQTVDRINRKVNRSPRDYVEQVSMVEKYQLLLGQAEHIMKLPTPAKKRRPF